MSDRFEGKGEKSMPYLDCSVKSCTYNNEDGCCCKGDIQVEGREATEHRAPVAEVSKTAEQTVQPVTH